MAINWYLASSFPGSLLPRAARQEARVHQWTLWAITELEPPVVAIMREGRRPKEQIDESRIDAALDTGGLPPLDLLIRTSGEQRLSNFLLWQAAYAELLFIDTLWPDFDEAVMQEALAEYARRERRYGGL